MNVLSLFDGMSCGQIALERAGITVSKYFASEIDKSAIKVTLSNYPETVQLGSVTSVLSKNLPKIDLLIGGSPCQGFSFAGKQLNFEDSRSKLFFEYVRLLNELKPKYFLLENVKMKKEYRDIISGLLGVEPIEIKSALVSAHNRKRLYWTNIPNIGQPKDKNILLNDIIDKNALFEDIVDISYFKGEGLSSFLDNSKREIIFNYSSSGRGNGRVESRFYEAEKAHTLTKSGYSNRAFTGVSLNRKIRRLTCNECEKLQNVPVDYTRGVSNSQRYKMLGNGWTVDVIAHIFKKIPR